MTKSEKTAHQQNTVKVPIVAIVGRPNVGKSSLFNRLTHSRMAITSETAGTTRDRKYHRATLDTLTITLVDTGGLEYGKKENIEADVQSQVTLAIDDADLILFMVDAKDPLTVEDYTAAEKLRKAKKPVLLIANKIDNKTAPENIQSLIKLGFGPPIEISAYHNIGIIDLIQEAEQTLTKKGFQPLPKDTIKHSTINICFLGKPNVGKSSMVNAILGKEQVIVSPTPGTTRDATDTEITWNEQVFNLIDTAGLRRRGRIERGLEKLSSFKSLDSIEKSDIVCLILDYEEGIRAQDQHISSYVQEAGKGLILIVNKADLMEDRQDDEKKMVSTLRSRFDFLPWAPVIFTSALRKKNVEKVLEVAREIYEERFRRVPDEELMEFMKEVTYKHMAPASGNKLPVFYSLIQDAVNPPSFVYFVNDPKTIHFSYRRYLENELRKKYGFNGTGIRIWYKPKTRPKKRLRKKKQ